MSVVLPPEITYGVVTGKLLQAVVDSSDADAFPDGIPVQGTVTFTPEVTALLVATSSPPVTILPQPITVGLDGNGAFTIELVATDDSLMNPQNWTYKVSFSLTGVKYASFSMAVPGGSTINLATAAPVPSSSGTPIVVGPQGAPGVGSGGVGIPTGGAAGYVLKKNSTSNYDVSWQAESGGGVGSSVWRVNSGAPTSGLGADGDFYLDSVTGNVYNKAAGTYTLSANIKGVAGATGSTGAAGTAGNTWRTGSGVPSNSLGVDGDLYLNTANGDVYKRTGGVYAVIANIKGATGATGSSVAGLTQIAVKTSAFTADVNEIIPVDSTSAAVTITLPTAPPDGTREVIQRINAANTHLVTIQAGGTDVFDSAGGPASKSLTVLNETAFLEYYAAGAIWVAISNYSDVAALRSYFGTLYVPIFGAVNNVTTAGTAQTIPSPAIYTENILKLTSASCALTLPTGMSGSTSIAVLMKQDATGGRDFTVTNSGLTWEGGVKPTLDGSPNALTWLLFYTSDGGTTYIGSGPETATLVRYDINNQGLSATQQQNARINIGAAHRLTPTGILTAAHTAVLGELVEVNATAGNVTITAPTGAPSGARFAVKRYDNTVNTVTVTRQGSDTFVTGVTSGTTYATAASVTLTIQETREWVSDGSGHWIIDAGTIPKSQLDTLYSGGSASRTVAWLPSDNALLGATDNPVMYSAGNTSLADSKTYTFKIFVKGGVPITKSLIDITVAGVAATGCYSALYDSSGNLIAGTGSADFSSGVTAVAPLPITLGASYTPSADGDIYVAIRSGTATTQPKVPTGSNPTVGNAGLSTSAVAGPTAPRYGIAANAWTGATPPATLGTIISAGAIVTFVGVQ